MFSVVYEFKINPGHSTEFETSWAEVTEAIRRTCASLGSRLHKTEDASTYVAYAQWPSRDAFERAGTADTFSPADADSRARMKSALESVRVVYQLTTVDDRLDTLRRT